MPYDGKLLALARTELERIKADNAAEQIRRQSYVYAVRPEIQEIDAEMRGQMSELVRLTVSHAPDIAERIDAMRIRSLAIQDRRAQLLSEMKLPEDYLDEIISCPRCRDTGIYEGGVCACLDKLYNKELTKELGTLISSGRESFESFDLKLYPPGIDPVHGVSPRETMYIVFRRCKAYAEKFPDNSPKNLMFQGGTGLGKTFLSACIARVVAAKGYSVCYDSAASALDCFEKAKFSHDEDAEAASTRVKRMLECDLMILDDLGTEMVTQMSVSALYTLVNTRLVNGKSTVISTNLSADELSAKYTPQIVSRLLGEYIRFPFIGSDIRQIKR